MKSKLEMAHEYLLKIMSNSPLVDQVDIEFAVDTAWSYARMMHSEKIKEDKTDSERKRKEIREMLNALNIFVEREGQYFDDVYECEVDWRVAPCWAKEWVMRYGVAKWECGTSSNSWEFAPSFGFTGSHVVERPHGF